jgi:LmbE family N-acetylglucosaminyl deacetylase
MAVILAVHAHPDDLELLAGGTLARLARAGHAVTMVTATAGDGGSAEYDGVETARIRQAEAAASAAHIGATYRCLGFSDFSVFNDDPTRRAVTELIRSVRPDVVITASPIDYHADHEAISQLVRDACFGAPVINYATGPSAPMEVIPHLYFTDATGARDREGRPMERHFGVDVAETFAAKQAMLAEHRSQAAWVARQHGVTDFLASMDAFTRRVGHDFGVELAEGFRQYRHQPYPTSPRLQDLLGDAVLSP